MALDDPILCLGSLGEDLLSCDLWVFIIHNTSYQKGISKELQYMKIFLLGLSYFLHHILTTEKSKNV